MDSGPSARRARKTEGPDDNWDNLPTDSRQRQPGTYRTTDGRESNSLEGPRSDKVAKAHGDLSTMAGSQRNTRTGSANVTRANNVQGHNAMTDKSKDEIRKRVLRGKGRTDARGRKI